MSKLNKSILTIMTGMFILLSMSITVIAAEIQQDYVTVTVEAVDDESGGVTYAIDTQDNWQSSNEFMVLSGTTHTIYAKDAAGNITSSTVYAAPAETYSYQDQILSDPDDEMLIKNVPESESSEYSGNGTGSITDYTSDASKEYYTITTSNGNNFYLIIDHRGSDQNVYLTKPVSELDLLELASEAGEVSKEEVEQVKEESAYVESIVEEQSIPEEKEDNIVMRILKILLVIGVIGGGYYYFNIYKRKKAISEEDDDALEMENFEAVDDDSLLFQGEKFLENEPDPEELLDEFFNSENEFSYEEDVDSLADEPEREDNANEITNEEYDPDEEKEEF